jgi:hypothetical protein
VRDDPDPGNFRYKTLRIARPITTIESHPKEKGKIQAPDPATPDDEIYSDGKGHGGLSKKVVAQ